MRSHPLRPGTLAAIIMMAAISCSQPDEVADSNVQPVFTVSNTCGLAKDVFYNSLISAQLTPILDDKALNKDEKVLALDQANNKIRENMAEAVAKIHDREPRFKYLAQRLTSQFNSEECVYIKLRLAEKYIERSNDT